MTNQKLLDKCVRTILEGNRIDYCALRLVSRAKVPIESFWATQVIAARALEMYREAHMKAMG